MRPAQLRRRVIDAVWALVAFAIVVICMVPFSGAHRLNRYWEIAKYLIIWGSVGSLVMVGL